MNLTKRFFIIFLPLFVLTTVITAGFLFQDLKVRQKVLEAGAMQQVEVLRRVASNSVQSVVTDLFFLAVNPIFHQMIDTGRPDIARELADVFLTFSKNSGCYDQIRFIDESGMERIRINFNNGRPHIVAADRLQNKANRYYFADTFASDPGRVFVSPMDLNIEQGKIEQPLKPMIRFGIPVTDLNGRKRGVILLNYFGSKLIDNLNQATNSKAGALMLLNADGYWLKGPNPENEWGFMYKDRKDRTLGRDDPQAWRRITAQHAGQFSNARGIYTFATILPIGRNMHSSTGAGEAFKASSAMLSDSDYYWKIVTLIPETDLNKQKSAIVYRWVSACTVAISLLLFASWGLALLAAQRKQAEDQRLRAEKLSGVLEMAGAVCHELNQPLMSALGYCELALTALSNKSPHFNEIKNVKNQVDRMGNITRKLMTITRYETKDYLDGKIIDLEKASKREPENDNNP